MSADPFEAEARELLGAIGLTRNQLRRDSGKVALVAQALRRERNRVIEACAYIVENRSAALFISRAETVEAIRKLKVNDGE